MSFVVGLFFAAQEIDPSQKILPMISSGRRFVQEAGLARLTAPLLEAPLSFGVARTGIFISRESGEGVDEFALSRSVG